MEPMGNFVNLSIPRIPMTYNFTCYTLGLDLKPYRSLWNPLRSPFEEPLEQALEALSSDEETPQRTSKSRGNAQEGRPEV